MVFTAVGITRNLHEYGEQRTEYEDACNHAIDALIQIRAQKTINYKREADLILVLEDIENRKNQSTSKTSIELGSKTVKLCAGPVAGIASSIVTSTLKKQGAGSEDLAADLAESALEVGIDQIKKEATKEICNATSDWAFGFAADWLGIAAGTAAIAFAPLTLGAVGLVGVTACAMSSTVRDTCSDYVSATAKGAQALFSEAVSDNKVPKIIDSYNLWKHKWTKYNESLSNFNPKYTKMTTWQEALAVQKKKFEAVDAEIKAGEKVFFNRFVRYVKGCDILSRLFSFFSTRFEKEKNTQNDLKLKKKTAKISVEWQTKRLATLKDEVNNLHTEIFREKLVVDKLEEEYLNHLA